MSTNTRLRDLIPTTEKEAITRVLSALGFKRVLLAMTKTCKPKYINDGWDNCFLVQAFGGKAKFDKMVLTHANTEFGRIDVIACFLGVSNDDVEMLINWFDSGDVTEDATDAEESLRNFRAFNMHVRRWLKRTEAAAVRKAEGL